MDESLDSLLGLGGSFGANMGIDGYKSQARLAELPIESIRPNEFQPRRHFDEEDLAGLARSIASLGVLQPVLVRPLGDDLYELIAGERRWRASRLAGLNVVPALVRDTGDQRSLEEALVENLHRADLNALEEAAALRQLMEDFELTQEQVSIKVGKSRSAVANSLRLFRLHPDVQRLIALGELSGGHAKALLGCPLESQQRELAIRAVTEELSVREVEDAVRRLGTGEGRGRGRADNVGTDVRDASVVEVESLLADRLNTRVRAETGKGSGRGRLSIEFADLDDLDRIYRLLVGLDS